MDSGLGCCLCVFFLIVRPPPGSTPTDHPFPFTTLFRTGARGPVIHRAAPRQHRCRVAPLLDASAQPPVHVALVVGARGRRVNRRFTAREVALGNVDIDRSEEHTSELQSLLRISYAVFCLNKKHPTHSVHAISNQQVHNNDYNYSSTVYSDT